MNHLGLNVSSNKQSIIDFRNHHNDLDTLSKLQKFQARASIQNTFTKTIKQTLIIENGAPYILVNTSLCKRPLKFLVDTGASISLIASDVVDRNIHKINYIVNLFGIMGREQSIKTEGMVTGILLINDNYLGTTLHVIDRKYSGPADGYFGFDLLNLYRMTINFDKGIIKINPRISNEINISDHNIINKYKKNNLETSSLQNDTNATNVSAKRNLMQRESGTQEKRLTRKKRIKSLEKQPKKATNVSYGESKGHLSNKNKNPKEENHQHKKNSKKETYKTKIQSAQYKNLAHRCITIESEGASFTKTPSHKADLANFSLRLMPVSVEKRESENKKLKKKLIGNPKGKQVKMEQECIHFSEINEPKKFLKLVSDSYECERNNAINFSPTTDGVRNAHKLKPSKIPTEEELKFFEYCKAIEHFEKEIKKAKQIKLNYGFGFIKKQMMHSDNEDRSLQIWQNLKLETCSDSERGTIQQLCSDFPNQFYLKGDALSCTNVMTHKIRLIPNSKPVFVRQYRIPDSHKRILAEILADYEKQGIIEKCQSDFNSPIMLLGKKDSTGSSDDYRLVVDYRKLNQIREIQNFPIPLIDDILNGLAGSLYYSCLDIKHAYWQIKLADEESRNASAFSANHFQYRWLRMPMGLSTACQTWQKTINTILEPLIGKGVYVYLDDVIVYAKNKKEHDETLWNVMDLLKDHNLQLKITKCNLYAKEFEYLGHIISKEGIKANPKKVEVIHNYPRPRTVKHIQRFLGMCNYFRRYVRNYAKMAKPLTSLLRKETPFVLAEAQQKAFDALKKALAEEVTLAFPTDEQLYVTCDSSSHSIGAMLSVGELPNDRPIYFFSKTLNDVQKRYSTIERELLAIVEAIKAFRVYLYGRFFILITDHKPLCHLFNMKNCNSRMFRQKLELMDYNFKIIHRPGCQNHVADALSRIEPLTLEEMLEREKIINAMTRGMTKQTLSGSSTFQIEELSGTILNKRSYDLVFHLVPIENDTLKNKLMNKFGITKFSNKFKVANRIHHFCAISNQFANSQNSESTQKCIESILKISEDLAANNIAINLDFDNIRHYIFFKNTSRNICLKNHHGNVIFEQNSGTNRKR